MLKEIAKRLHNAKLTINFEKCEFCRSSLSYLGFVVDKCGFRTNPEKVEAMVNFPRLQTVIQLQRFLGMCSWYHKFIPLSSTLTAPLNDLQKGKKKSQTLP